MEKFMESIKWITRKSFAVRFGRWLLKYAKPVFNERYLCWSYENKFYDTDELYEVFIETQLDDSKTVIGIDLEKLKRSTAEALDNITQDDLDKYFPNEEDKISYNWEHFFTSGAIHHKGHSTWAQFANSVASLEETTADKVVKDQTILREHIRVVKFKDNQPVKFWYFVIPK